MVLGIGRGDSALAHLRRAPARLAWFESYLAALQAYLRGDEVSFADAAIPDDAAPLADKLGLAHGPASSAIRWIGAGTHVDGAERLEGALPRHGFADDDEAVAVQRALLVEAQFVCMHGVLPRGMSL